MEQIFDKPTSEGREQACFMSEQGRRTNIYHLAIDIGASGGRHILGYISKGKLYTEEIYRFSNSADKKNKKLLWNTERLFNEIINGLKKCGEIGKIPRTVGIDTWGVDYVLLDNNGDEISPIYCYRDDRTEAYLNTFVSFEELYKKTGIAFNKFNTMYQLLSDKFAGRLDNAKEFLMLPEYFSYLLTSKKAHEYTNATTTGLINAKTKQWDFEIIKTLSLPPEMFGDIVSAGHILGTFTEEIKNAVGFDSTVILPATHDTASAVVSAKEGIPYISSGTWSLLGIVGEPILTNRARECNYTNEGAANGKIRFLKNIMGLWIIQEVRRELDNKFSFATLAEMAEHEAVYDWKIDINKPEFFAPDSMIEAIKTECKRMGQPIPKLPGEIAYCVFNSLAYNYKAAIKELESIIGKRFDAINIIGGGSNNRYLNNLTAKVAGKRVVAGPAEATAIGNLLVQIKAFNNLSENEIEELKNKSFETEVFESV